LDVVKLKEKKASLGSNHIDKLEHPMAA